MIKRLLTFKDSFFNLFLYKIKGVDKYVKVYRENS